MVFALPVDQLRLAEKPVVDALDSPAYLTPIEIGNDRCACVCSQSRRQLVILQQRNDSLAERLAIVIGHNECIV